MGNSHEGTRFALANTEDWINASALNSTTDQGMPMVVKI
jgi:hypothetical protein